MNARIERLRGECLAALPSVSGERARLLTAFYKSLDPKAHPVPVQRALAFRYLAEHQSIHIGDGELIVGERGPHPKATPTYPELCCHTLDDLDVLPTRGKTPFRVDEAVHTLYADEVIPYWRDRSMRTHVFAAMSSEWKAAFDAGVFTEFMEQRSPGHAVLDDKIYRLGFDDVKTWISASAARISASGDPKEADKLAELEAMSICCDAIVCFAERHARHARELSKGTHDPIRQAELAQIAEICEWVPRRAPRTFREALQMYWFVHLGVVIELNEWDSLNPGRIDQHLYPFYRREVDLGQLTPERAKELLECFWIKFSNQPAPPKVGVTEEQSATYNDFTLINTGGVDRNGGDGVNELSYLILDVIEEMRLPYTGSCIQLSKVNPDRFLLRTLEVVRRGFGQPSIFNTDAICLEFLRAGKSLEDARAGGPSGCVTVSAFGKESCVLTGYMNWPKILEITLHDGIDPRTGRRLGPATGDPRSFHSLDQLFDAYQTQLKHFVDLKIHGNHRIERLFAENMPAPFLSTVIEDCIDRGEDYNDGGPRYPTTYLQGVGLGTTTDALAAIGEHVFAHQDFTMTELLDALDADFEGFEPLQRKLLRHSPKFGNGDENADAIAQRLFDIYFFAIDGRPNTKGGRYRINLLPTTVHVFFGEMVGATADGRRACVPLSDGISPVQGADTLGPTAVIRSAGKIDHVRTGGTLLNQRFLPDVLRDESGLRKLADLVRTYFRLDGHHIQFNVVDSATLREAQQDPESHRDLIVRVAGYSDYFNNLDRPLQDEIIARTAHESA
ncbi:glycyl radical protein [Candidatus Bipolaricaulota bacterium]|nr:glycyl radical protein [Candidatus Bipolaricaulota bacterium]